MKLLRKKVIGWAAAAALAIGSMGIVPQKAQADIVAICAIGCNDSGCLIVCIVFSN